MRPEVIPGAATQRWIGPSYFNGNEFYISDEVKMPNVFDLFVSLGYIKNGLQVELSYMQQNTLGGGDIRRQDMPFVSNRMNAIKVGALVMYYLPKTKTPGPSSKH
jgi:hypothetical protein